MCCFTGLQNIRIILIDFVVVVDEDDLHSNIDSYLDSRYFIIIM